MLDFSGTNYLGIDRHSAFQELVKEGISKYGLHYGGSRFANNCPEVFEEAEQLCCDLSGAEAALMVSSGTIAALLATKAIDEEAMVFHTPNTHAALLNGAFQSRPLSSFSPELHGQQPVYFLGNSVDALQCHPTHFHFTKKLKKDHRLIIDDSHGIGIYGKKGTGVFSFLQKITEAKVTIVASLGKAPGIPGGLILSNKDLINRIKSLATFGGSAPPPPAYIYAFVKGQKIYTEQREQLQKNIQQFRAAIQDLNLFRFLKNYPVFYSKENELAGYLKSKGVRISAFRYPTSKDELISRLVISAKHQSMELDQIIEAIQTYHKNKY